MLGSERTLGERNVSNHQSGKLYFAGGLGRRIRFARENAGLSVNELAEWMDVSPSAIRNWEGDFKFPSHKNMDTLALFLTVDATWLQTGVRTTESEPKEPMTPQRFYLIAERREDGGLRITCPEVPGLVLSGADPHAVMRDVVPAIDALMRRNGPLNPSPPPSA